MALSEDQTALLRLLLAGDTYEGVADVLGTTADDVRARAHTAADALATEPDGEFPQEAVNTRLAALEGAPVVAASEPVPAMGDRRRLLLWVVGAGALAVVLVVILLATGGGGNGNASDQGGSSAAPDREDVVPVRMSPVGGSHASGTVAIVRAGDQPALDLAIRGLRPTASGETYVLWFVGAGNRSLPVAFQAVGRDGRVTGRAAIPTAASSLLPSFDSAELTFTRQRAAAAAVRHAAQTGTLPEPVGTVVMRGALR
jgi:hypothetical protein